MTLVRRVTALEASMTSAQLVIRWLNAAHSHGSLTAYVAAILDDEPEDFPRHTLIPLFARARSTQHVVENRLRRLAAALGADGTHGLNA